MRQGLFLLVCFLVAANILPAQSNYKVKTVVLDAGHGGHDSGCHGSSAYEKNVALAIVLKLGEYIEREFSDVNVIYTRKTDVFIPLHERAEIANKAKADLFISVHCNAASPAAIGTETYVMGLHKSEDNLTVAKRENESILLEDDYKDIYEYNPNSPLAHIIFSVHQNAYLDQSIAFASEVQAQFTDRVRRKNRGVKQAGFLVLYRTSMPSVLIESGFLTNRDEEQFLRTSYGQDLIASGIFRAFRKFKNELDNSSKGLKEAKPEISRRRGVSIPKRETMIESADKGVEKVAPGTKEYRVQVFAGKNKLNLKQAPFNKFSDIYYEKGDDGFYRYFIGRYSDLDKAKQRMNSVKNDGIQNCYIAVYKDGKKVG